MFRRQSQSSKTCQQCGKSLQMVQCPNCGGKGFIRELIFFKSDCTNCLGTGNILRCPDYYQHVFRPSLKKLPTYKPIKPIKPIKPLQRPMTPPPPHALPPWDPRNPNTLNPNHPRSPYNPNNPNSPLNPSNPRNPNNPMNPMNPNNPFKK